MNLTLIFRIVAVAVIGGLTAYIAFGPGAEHGLRILALLLGWASYSRFGGKLSGFGQSVLHNLVGAAFALAAIALAVQHATLGRVFDFAIWSAISVALSLALLFFASRSPRISDFGALLIGYAAIAGTAGIGSLGAFLTPSLANPALGILLSLLIGALLACGVDYLAGGLEQVAMRRAAAGARGADA
ncbi:DUF1097 family protein [Methylocystis heyeri]|uniref:DUF1097 domain-containing protein n=1 Tax=Methylocystis heyeri TaxID=391905 RepID=A0A6B8KGQ4_9HYPH|nr:DUF1097 family protein [Methylocystis heyeri]QGM46799.1 DUF1097 domain-containing protein [Methylocystis heyeri]